MAGSTPPTNADHCSAAVPAASPCKRLHRRRAAQVGGQCGRIIVSHDFRTLPPCRLASRGTGMALPDLLLVPSDATIGQVVEDLFLIAEVAGEDDLRDQV